MQAQPRGKERSPKENVTVGGKNSKKRDEPKPLFVQRDIANFLPRAKIQQLRQTSSHSNKSAGAFPSLLPRFKYYYLGVIFACGGQCIVQKNGFLDGQSDYLMKGDEFNTINDYGDAEDGARELDRQRLFLNKPDSEVVAFLLCKDRPGWGGPRGVVCRVSNRLTEKTAPAMLHFLHHLSQACYEHIEIYPGATADAEECAFNPLVLRAIPKFQLRGVKFGRAFEWEWTAYTAVLSKLTVQMASQMRIRYNLLYYYSRSYDFHSDPSQLLDFIATGRQLDRRLEFGGIISHPEVAQIIKHFKEDVSSLRGAIRDVRYENTVNEGIVWPARCPREAATQVTRNGDGTVEHRFDYTNAHSKEPFSLLLGTRHHEGRTRIPKFHLKFGST